MNKLNYLLLGAAGLMLASCSQEEIVPQAQGEGTYSVTVKLPGNVRTRDVGDTFGGGLPSTMLSYVVYDANTLSEENVAAAYVFEGSTEFPEGELETTVDFELTKGQSYKIAFFAQDPASTEVYEFDGKTGVVSVNYAEMDSKENLADAYDCYYSMLETGVISATSTLSTTLNRPVAQINWGTNDLTDANGNATIIAHDDAYGSYGQFVVSTLEIDVYTSFSLVKGDVSGVPSSQTITGLASPTKLPSAPAYPYTPADESVTYDYIAMQYVLAPQEEAITDLTATFSNLGKVEPATATSEVKVSNVPLQANYRTNIFGALLSDNVVLNVVKNNIWDNEYNVSYDDPDAPIQDENGNYLISSPEDFAWIGNQVNNGKSLYGETFVLQNDLDLNGATIDPIGIASPDMDINFGGTFDGNNLTISNFTVNNGQAAGLFGNIGRGQVMNLNVENATIITNHWGGVIAGYINNQYSQVTSISGCNVKNSTVIATCVLSGTTYDDGDKVGAIVGYAGPKAIIENCSAEGCTLQAYRNLGGLVGYMNGGTAPAQLNNSNVSNTNIFWNLTYNPENITVAQQDAYVGEIVGTAAQGAVQSGDTSSEVTIYPATALISTEMGNLNLTLRQGYSAYLQSDYSGSSSIVESTNRALALLAGGTIYGNGYTLTVTPRANASNILTSGGTIEDVTLVNNSSSGRAVYGVNMTSDLTITNSTLNGTWALNSSSNSDTKYVLTVSNTNFYGYVSPAGFTSGTYTECNFYQGTVADGNGNTYKTINPYETSTFTDCTFIEGYGLNLSSFTSGMTVTFNNCTVEGEVLSADNIQTLLNVVLPSEATDLSDYVKFGN